MYVGNGEPTQLLYERANTGSLSRDKALVAEPDKAKLLSAPGCAQYLAFQSTAIIG